MVGLPVTSARSAPKLHRSEAIITFFTDDGDVWGFPFFGLLATQYTARNHTLALQWQGAQVLIQGPRARDFFTAFAKGSATARANHSQPKTSVKD